MNILILEPYYTGSHAAWAQGYARHSRHTVTILKMEGRFWKWRMHGGAVTLARKFLAGKYRPDLLLATDMLDLTTFLALTRQKTAAIPTAIYFHENQLSYPWSPTDRDIAYRRDKHYGFINYVSALAADTVFFNSQYHLNSFLDELPRLLKHFPDYNEPESIPTIRHKSKVLPLGLNLRRFDEYRPAASQGDPRPPLILWNHRWEYDKNPAGFFRALQLLAEHNLDFEVAILGQSFRQQPEEFITAQARLGKRVVHMGYVQDFAAYARWLWQADLLPVTSNQDFFGASVMQALYCCCYPLLPKRLAYPELIPPERHHQFFYTDFEELVARLETALNNPQAIRTPNLRETAAQFDWSVQASHYDAALKAVAGKISPAKRGG